MSCKAQNNACVSIAFTSGIGVRVKTLMSYENKTVLLEGQTTANCGQYDVNNVDVNS